MVIEDGVIVFPFYIYSSFTEYLCPLLVSYHLKISASVHISRTMRTIVVDIISSSVLNLST